MKSPRKKVNTRGVHQSRDSQSLVRREFRAHLMLTFILLFQCTTAQKGNGKVKNQSQHFFPRKGELSGKSSSNYITTFQYFPSSCPVTAVLQRSYTVMNDKEENTPNKDTYSKVIILIKRNTRIMLLAQYFMFEDFMLEESWHLYITWVKDL